MADAKQKRRKHPRYKVSAKVDVSGRELLLYHKIHNFSLGGICIQTAVPEDVGAIVDLTIELPDGDQLTVQGEVVWVNRESPMDMGIRYLNLDERKLEKLKKLLAQAQAQAQAKMGAT